MKKIIITGGNGFIGTNLVKELLKDKNNKIINIDKYSYSSNSYLIKKNLKNYKNIKLDFIKD
jgi:dTDP-D-glucose 4,6-dehydratase